MLHFQVPLLGTTSAVVYTEGTNKVLDTHRAWILVERGGEKKHISIQQVYLYAYAYISIDICIYMHAYS